jgi:signal peptidase I
MNLFRIALRTLGMPETNYDPPYLLFFVIFIIFLASLAIVILMTIVYWKLFKKAGEKGWKALIPIYGEWIKYKITLNNPDFLFVLSLIPGIGLIPIIYVNYKFAYRFSRDGGIGVLYCLFPLIVGPMHRINPNNTSLQKLWQFAK